MVSWLSHLYDKMVFIYWNRTQCSLLQRLCNFFKKLWKGNFNYATYMALRFCTCTNSSDVNLCKILWWYGTWYLKFHCAFHEVNILETWDVQYADVISPFEIQLKECVWQFYQVTCQMLGYQASRDLIIGYLDGLVQDCRNSSALAMELLQSCTKPSIWYWDIWAPSQYKDRLIYVWRFPC